MIFKFLLLLQSPVAVMQNRNVKERLILAKVLGLFDGGREVNPGSFRKKNGSCGAEKSDESKKEEWKRLPDGRLKAIN